ncbi:MATE family efflux transporter [Pseudodesulfovibrio sp. JC047]|nr:MATE family efflux transporter [Pseudodesulfovibrio sp. JC047]
MRESSKEHPFQKKPNRTLVRLAFPVLFSLVAEPLTGLADTAFVARLAGAEPVAALGVGTVAFTSLFWAFTFLGVGTQTAVAQALGRDEQQRATRVVSLACLLALVFGGGLLFGTIGFLSPIAALFGAEGVVNDLACDYMTYRLVGAPAVLISLACFGAFRGLQDMHTPLYVAVAVNLLNIVLDWILIFGSGGLSPLGVAGAAIASTISQWIGAVWCVWGVWRRLGWTWKVHGSDVARLMKVGGDLSIRTGAVLVFLALCTRVANQYGPNEGAAYQAIRQFYIFSALFLDAFAVTGQSLVGYFVGAADRMQARRVARVVCLWSLGTGTVLCLFMLLAEQGVAWLLVPSTAHGIFGPAWIVVALTQPLGSLSFATDGIHWGTGDFRYLRNAMLVACMIGGACLWMMRFFQPSNVLVFIWLVTALWTFIRAGFGIVRLWPGIGDAPLAQKTAKKSALR